MLAATHKLDNPISRPYPSKNSLPGSPESKTEIANICKCFNF